MRASRRVTNGIVADLLVDSDVFIDHLRGAHRLAVEGDRVSYSVITRCELFAGSSVDEPGLRTLLAPFTELSVDRSIAERAGRIRRDTATRIADALIAATAIEHDLALVTRNIRHFSQVSGLVLQAPREKEGTE
jgi:predicted nucleic acid-binding protein